MNALHRYVIQPEGAERRELLAERDLLAEGLTHMRNQIRSDIWRYKRTKRKLREMNRKLRGES